MFSIEIFIFFFFVQFVNQLGTKLILLARDSQITSLVTRKGPIYTETINNKEKRSRRGLISFLREDNNLISMLYRSVNMWENKVERRFIRAHDPYQSY